MLGASDANTIANKAILCIQRNNFFDNMHVF
jgi:hypothetical protein